MSKELTASELRRIKWDRAMVKPTTWNWSRTTEMTVVEAKAGPVSASAVLRRMHIGGEYYTIEVYKDAKLAGRMILEPWVGHVLADRFCRKAINAIFSASCKHRRVHENRAIRAAVGAAVGGGTPTLPTETAGGGFVETALPTI